MAVARERKWQRCESESSGSEGERSSWVTTGEDGGEGILRVEAKDRGRWRFGEVEDRGR